MIEGIDVSYYQRITNWPTIAQAKKFAIVRSGDGSLLDYQTLPYARDAYKAGCAVDIYHYIRLGLTPQAQADIIAPRWYLINSFLPANILWLDWEDTGDSIKAMSVKQRKDWMLTFINLPSVANISGGDYTGKWWVDAYLGGSWPEGWPQNRKRWIGQYGPWSGFFKSDPTAAGFQPTLFPGWPDWDVWQYSSSGQVAGITNAVDLDIAKEEMSMALEERLQKLERAIELEQEKDEIRADLEAWLKVYEESPQVQSLPFRILLRKHVWWRLASMGVVPTDLPDVLKVS